jgi:carbonic anhydrase
MAPYHRRRYHINRAGRSLVLSANRVEDFAAQWDAMARLMEQPMKSRTLISLWSFAALSTVLFLSTPAAFAQQHPAGGAPHWSYSGPDGPDHWGDLDPSFAACKTGQRQAPIDIKDAKPADLKPIGFDYKLSPMKIVNNGHTIRVDYEAGSSITVDGKQYPLVQFHFHHPSEEEINGQKFDMVLHLVHVSADGHAIAVGVLLKSGNENPLIRDIWAHIPREVDKEVEFKKIVINAADLLPADRNYYSFDGSLTIPPCGDVKWFVMKTPVELSPAQIAAFAKLYPDNARPIQPTNGREIEESDFTK